MAAPIRRGQGPLALRGTWAATQAAARISPRLAGRFAERLWFTPWPVGRGAAQQAREANWLAETEPLELVVDGLRLAGYTAGRGPVVLLVHGWGEQAARMGAFVRPLVAAGFRAVGVDLPSHGASDSAPTDLYALSATLRTAAEALGASAVVAHSMGGPVTMLALRDGLALDAVALVGSGVRLEHALDRFAELVRLPAPTLDALRARLERRFGDDVWTHLRADAAAPDFAVPALVLHDEHDTEVPVDDARRLAAAWPGAVLELSEGLGHLQILRDDEVTRRVAAFLASVVDRAEPLAG